MGIAVYPRLGEVLAANRMSVAELERRIEQRFGEVTGELDAALAWWRNVAADPHWRQDLAVRTRPHRRRAVVSVE